MMDKPELRNIDRLLLEFGQIVGENTKDLCADERMVARVRSAIEREPKKRRLHGLALGLAAAACLLLMVVSGSLLFPYFLVGEPDSFSESRNTTIAPSSIAAHPLSASAELSYTSDGTPLPYAVVSVEEYSEGYAVALASNGKYGYVNEKGNWVLNAIYDQAYAANKGCAEVVYNGREMTVMIP